MVARRAACAAPTHLRLPHPVRGWRDAQTGSQGGSDDPVDRVILDPLAGDENDDLTDQAERDHLNAEHDEQHAQDERRPIGQRHAEEQAVKIKPIRRMGKPIVPKKRSGLWMNFRTT
jgi:hypothetical protein